MNAFAEIKMIKNIHVSCVCVNKNKTKITYLIGKMYCIKDKINDQRQLCRISLYFVFCVIFNFILNFFNIYHALDEISI